MTATPAKEVTRLRDLKVSARDQLMIDPRIIEIEDGHNPRDYNLPDNRQHLDELKASIRENGTRVPVLVRFDSGSKKVFIVDGECRLRANLELIAEGVQIEAVPTIQVEGGNEADRLLTALTANTGKPLSQWESGGAFRRLQRFGWTEEKIATKMGYSVRFVKEAIELADAPEAVKEMLSKEAVTPSLALHEMRVNGSEAVNELRKKANAAQARGKKTATKTQVNRVPEPKNMMKLVQQLIESAEGDIFATEFRFVEVERSTMVKLAAMCGIKKDKKSA